VESEEGAAHPPLGIFEFKSKNGAFCALVVVSIDLILKVCRLIIETVSDHIRKTVANRLCFPLLFHS